LLYEFRIVVLDEHLLIKWALSLKGLEEGPVHKGVQGLDLESKRDSLN
jgi:hypothetical protein